MKLSASKDRKRSVTCISKIGEAESAIRWIMDMTSHFLKTSAHQRPCILLYVFIRLNKQPILIIVKTGRYWLRDGLEICPSLQIKFAGFKDLAPYSGDGYSISLVPAINCISCEIWRLATSGTSFVKDFCDFVEFFVFLTKTINLVVFLQWCSSQRSQFLAEK